MQKHKKVKPQVPPASLSVLTPYQGPWDPQAAAHLLRRTLFGFTKAQLKQALDLGFMGTLEKLFSPSPIPDLLPLNYRFDKDPAVPLGDTWVDKTLESGTNGYKRNSLESWCMLNMLKQDISLKEKMVLFWHNHFATELSIYNDARYGYMYMKTLRDNCLGNVRTLVEQITLSPAMLRYLNGNQNSRQSPNENYARELFELFSLGKGGTLSEGNYGTYTETDIQEAARVLTGWRDRGARESGNQIHAEFFPNRHDGGTKQFSASLNHATIEAAGKDEYKLLINLIFQHEACATFICRKLVRWFLHYEIDEALEESLVIPLAQLLREHDYEIAPVVRSLLESERFFDPYFRGAMIKNPLDFIFSGLKVLRLNASESEPLFFEGVLGEYLFLAAKEQQMPVLHPPSVAGWPAYYQIPQYYNLWINSVTLFERNRLREAMAKGVSRRGTKFKWSIIEILDELEDPTNPAALIQEIAMHLLPLPLTDDQLTEFKEALLPGLPDYEWSLEYGEYLLDTGNMPLKNSLERKLWALFQSILSTPEFHLT